ncbi:hypothetical protein V6N13_014132 [Hibiscus sabdariffa]
MTVLEVESLVLNQSVRLVLISGPGAVGAGSSTIFAALNNVIAVRATVFLGTIVWFLEVHQMRWQAPASILQLINQQHIPSILYPRFTPCNRAI